MEGMEVMDTCAEVLNVSFGNCSIDTSVFEDSNCSHRLPSFQEDRCSNGGLCESTVSLDRGATIILVLVISLIGNLCTILMLSQFKVHKIPDVLVVGLALTDLLATLIPVPMSTYAYFAGVDFAEGCLLCDFFGTLAQFTRYASALIVTLVSLERYFAVNRPFTYRKHATPKRFVFILILCWILALSLAVVPLFDGDTLITTHSGFCLFSLTSRYAIAILIYSGFQYVAVFLCFILVTVELIKVYRRRKELKVQGKYNRYSRAQHRESELTFTRPNLTSRISDIGKSIKKAAPIITEKFQLSVEAQFARMLFAVVALFYISWSTIVVVIVIAQIKRSSSGLENALFWGIRLSIISTAINPFLYGILARQYRLAYYYMVRLWLSKCFCCISPPLKDVFAAARNGSGDVYKDGRRGSHQSGRYGTPRSVGSQSGYSYVNNPSVKLTNSTQLNITLPPSLNRIQEELSLEVNESSIAAEFTTHVSTAGELSSTVIIPHQARDHNDSSTVDLQLRGAASMQDLVDAGMVELGNSNNPQEGVKNPLAVMTKIIGGEEVFVSPGGSDFDSEGVESPPLFSNPVFGLVNGKSKKTREQLELNMSRRQVLAASSTDDITLISKKKKVAKTHSNDVPFQSSSASQEGTSKRLKGMTLPLGQALHLNKEKGGKGCNQSKPPLEETHKTGNGYIPVTDIDTGVSVLVPKRGDLNSDGIKYGNKASSCSPSRGNGSVPPLKKIQNHTHTKSFDSMMSDPQPRSTHRARYSELQDKSHVHELSKKFESTISTSHDPEDCQSNTTHQTTRRQNSVENSDSGRESMVLESETVGVQTA